MDSSVSASEGLPRGRGQAGLEDDQEDRWRVITEEVLEAEEIDSFSEDPSHLTGALTLPVLSVPNKKQTKRLTKAPNSVPKPAKAKQKTLAQVMSDADVERLFSKYHHSDLEEEEDNVDVSRFLKDDDSDEDADLRGGDAPLTASDLLFKLTSSAPNVASIPPLKKGTDSQTNSKDEEGMPLVTLEDEPLVFNTKDTVSKPQPKKLLDTRGKESTGTGYLTVAVSKEKVNIQGSVLLQSKETPNRCASPEQVTASDGLFYWLDAREQQHTLSVDPGSIFLFGKMLVEKNGQGRYRSCCIRVLNAYRSTFLLPQKGSSEADVVRDINEVCRSHGIEQRRIKFVERYYAFDGLNIPREKSTWAKLRYLGKYPPFPSKAAMKHVETIRGANTSLLELFLLKRRLMGPCFIHVAGMAAATSRISHCDLEFVVDSPKKITVESSSRPVPPLTMASIQLHTQLDSRGAANEVLAASIAVYRDVNTEALLKPMPQSVFTAVRPLTDGPPLPLDLKNYCALKGLPGVYPCASERDLLAWLASTLADVDPDILIGHNFLGFTLDALLRRYQDLSVPGWSTLGRLALKRMPRFFGSTQSLHQEKEVCVGRMVADTYLLSREYFKTVNYKLASLAEQMQLQGIATGTAVLDSAAAFTTGMMSSSNDLFEALLQVCNSTVLAVGVLSHLDALRLTRRLTVLAGNLWSRTLCGARSERTEYLLLHTFYELKFIMPEKKTFDAKRQRADDDDDAEDGKRRSKYQGGMVLDPKCGLYSDFVLLLDFNSLYPSLIQEFNICFTTVDCYGKEDAEVPPPENLVCLHCVSSGLPSPCKHKCILPRVIRGLVESRREVKRLMKTERDPSRLALLEIRQKALKLTANSMYGCLGFEHSRFFAQSLAELVTRQGRLALQNTVDLIPQIHPSLSVLYGDTDSVMIQTGIKDDIKAVRDLGWEIKATVNKRYQSLEIDIDGVFRAILLLKKKKYAALCVTDWSGAGVTYTKEVKGLDMVRRDWCPLSKSVSEAVLNRVLNAEGSEDILDYIMNFMRDVAEHVRLGDRYTLDQFVISKSLTKEPEAYQGNAYPHAAVALRMKRRKEMVRVGDLIPYVICVGDKLSDRAYHIDEVQNNTSLRVDAEWYLTAQVYPPVMRLCEHIQGFSAAHLSEAMGIVTHHSAKADVHDLAIADTFSHCGMFKSRALSECFPEALQLQVQCPRCLCKTPVDPHKRILDVLEAGADEQDSSGKFDLYVCTGCGKSLPVTLVANCFTQMCYDILRQFYQSGGGPAAVQAVRQQFTYFRALFDVPHAPGCPLPVKDAHRTRARRCLGLDRSIYTLEEAADPAIAEAQDPVDPLQAAADTIYKRIDHLFIRLDSLFGD